MRALSAATRLLRVLRPSVDRASTCASSTRRATTSPIGERGEVIFGGPHVMRGYHRDPERTAEALIDGWMHSGDIAELDDEGYLYIVDRLKHLIIRGGQNIAPTEIENVLYRHPAVLEAAVVGAPDPSGVSASSPSSRCRTASSSTLTRCLAGSVSSRTWPASSAPRGPHRRSPCRRTPSARSTRRRSGRVLGRDGRSDRGPDPRRRGGRRALHRSQSPASADADGQARWSTRPSMRASRPRSARSTTPGSTFAEIDGISARWPGPGGTVFHPGSADWAEPARTAAALDRRHLSPGRAGGARRRGARSSTGQCDVVLVVGGQAGVLGGGQVASYTRPDNEFIATWGSITQAQFALVAQVYLHRFRPDRTVWRASPRTIRNAGSLNPERGHDRPRSVHRGRRARLADDREPLPPARGVPGQRGRRGDGADLGRTCRGPGAPRRAHPRRRL